jgi:hypothetical protein
MRRIYLDYNASTPVDPRVAEAMRAATEDGYGNPSSLHWAGAPAKEIVEKSRQQVAALLGCAPEGIVFTSGGSEANNLALKGMFFARRDRAVHIITTQVEHPSILSPCGFLERQGARVTYLPVDGTGLVDPDDLRRAIARDTILVSVMHTRTTKSARSNRSKRAPASRGSTAFPSTRMPRNYPWARYRLASMSWASTSFRLPVTNSTRRRGLVRSTCVPERSSSH